MIPNGFSKSSSDAGAGAPSLPAPKPAAAWSGRSRGGYFGNWFFVQLIRLLGRRWAYAWLVLVAAYFTVACPRAYRASVQYLQRVLGPAPFWKRPVLVYRHFFAYGVSLLDRLAVIMGRAKLDCQIEDDSKFLEFLNRGQGIILVGAHLGNWELGGHVLGRLGKPVNLVVLEKETASLRQLFDRALAAKQFRLLTTDEHPLRGIPALAALRRGEIVALHGDRSFGGADLAVPFLGGHARFPIGPYVLAAISGAPIFQVFGVRERMGHYRFFSDPPEFVSRDVLRNRTERLQPLVTAYARRLAMLARQYPFQWCNFYPFWTDDAAEPRPEADPLATREPTHP
jgi:predicted LPLAT superfamily acyltransferase